MALVNSCKRPKASYENMSGTPCVFDCGAGGKGNDLIKCEVDFSSQAAISSIDVTINGTTQTISFGETLTDGTVDLVNGIITRPDNSVKFIAPQVITQKSGRNTISGDSAVTNISVTFTKVGPSVSGGALMPSFKIPSPAIAKKIYGFHIDSSNDSPSAAVTYLEDAIGMTPAYMDFANDVFVWGDWEDAFFMPRPCMLKNDGTVDYYLDPDDYSKKTDGTASDISSDAYAGNAMIEWGQNGQRIWYKIVPDVNDDTSASIYIANYRADEDYNAWSFYDANNKLKEHFYTPIYNGSIVNNGTNDVLRSLSGKTYDKLCQGKTAAVEVTMAERNNVGSDKGWFTEVNADVDLIHWLLILISKSLDVQTSFGAGNMSQSSAAANMLTTGTMDQKGFFWGDDSGLQGVKVFGMENFWANQWRRYAGLWLSDGAYKYKMTRGTADGSTATDYSTSSPTGYLDGAAASPTSNGYYSKMTYNKKTAFISSVTGGSQTKYYCDYFYQNQSGLRYALRGGGCILGRICGFSVSLYSTAGGTVWSFGASLSYK